MSTREILTLAESLSPEERAAASLEWESRWCWHCGGPQGECECGWPKGEPEAAADFTVSCGNVFADLGLPDADALLAAADATLAAARIAEGFTYTTTPADAPRGFAFGVEFAKRHIAEQILAASLASPNRKEEP